MKGLSSSLYHYIAPPNRLLNFRYYFSSPPVSSSLGLSRRICLGLPCGEIFSKSTFEEAKKGRGGGELRRRKRTKDVFLL